MFIDTRTIEEGSCVERAVCIIGAGAAGITLALEMEKLGIDTCVLESGGFKPDEQTRDLYRGENAGLPYQFADGSRSRYLGGSSNCWGGWCRPLDPFDFEKRDWVAHSGWPFGLDEFAPYYARTHAVLRLGPHNFDPQFWETSIGRRDVRRVPLVTGNVRDMISQFSPPARFGKLYRKDLGQSRRVSVYLYANVVNIETSGEARTVSKVQVATLSGRRISVRAKIFVLATGGIENARLLLASNEVQPDGLGNGNDLVGRFYMDHPRLMSATVRFNRAWSRDKLYDIKYHYQNNAVSAHGTRIASQFALTPELLKRERLLNARVWFFSLFSGEGSEAAEALIRCKQALLHKDQPGWRPARDLATMVAHPVDTLGFGVTRILHPRPLIRQVKMQAIAEAEPNPDSRVTLSPQKDQLGMNRVRVAWHLTSNVQRTFDRTFALVGEELERSGVAQVTLDPPIEGGSWPAELEGTWHHMGTTRMHDSPREGVVDRNCRVHGMTNLYIAGSSVFPTVGSNFPTITIVALALRLAGRIASELGVSQAGIGGQHRTSDAHDGPRVPADDELTWTAMSLDSSGTLLPFGKK